ncbi:MAG: hypothetical protein AAB433_03805 [Nitrospirota bacterium]
MSEPGKPYDGWIARSVPAKTRQNRQGIPGEGMVCEGEPVPPWEWRKRRSRE